MPNIRSVVLIACFLSAGIFQASVFSMAEDRNASLGKMSSEEYQGAIRKQNEIHGFIRAATAYEKKGDHQKALENYLKAYEINQCAGLIAVCRGALADNYEMVGEYQKALMHVEWALGKIDSDVPLYQETIKAKERLLQKIEAQKSWEAKQDPVIPKFREGFQKASPEKQREFLEGLGGPGIMDVFKEAMVAEHGGDFKKALGIYESLLPRKADIEKEFGIDGWVMIYPAIQRNAEMLKDAAKEKEALIWMKENLLPEKARYHTALSKLMPQNVTHIEKRIKDYQL